MGSAIDDAWDSVTDVFSDAGHGIQKAWKKGWVYKGYESLKGSDSHSDSHSYDLTPSGSSSACGGGACAKAADETNIPAVAQSISGDAAQAVEAQGTARKRARGIMQTYTRYDSSADGGKSKLGE